MTLDEMADHRNVASLQYDLDQAVHSVRHTACSYMVQAGISLYAVGVIAGHRSPAQTARYAHLI